MTVRSTLTTDFTRMQRRLPKMFEEAAAEASKITVSEVKKRTPRGHKIDPETGANLGPSDELRKSILPIKPRRLHRKEGGWVGGAYSELPEATWVEKGTRPHAIPRPGSKTVLRYWSHGQLHYSRRVKHPGTLGQHMFLRGGKAAEGRIKIDLDQRLTVTLR